MTSGGGNNSFMSDINVTPFVDVMLVLLIIFMVTAPMMTQGVDVALPEATADPLPAEKEHLMISINTQAAVFINDVPVSVEELNEKLKRIMSTRSDRAVYLKADKDIPYGMVVRVMSEIKLAGVERLGMVTVPPTEEAKVTKK
ncbi:MAG: protein TolR [Deltaproteobacteria bacterium]|nr:protein TolR [Deltaproteobacteria bacterium]